ncbi:MAG: hypothetical protein IPK12_15160 [Gemmatimonadetes bacterium]|nr:hypothetical protein [Gemmatimonadota bacterium]
MRIGVDATCWANGRGYGRFTRSLLAEMAALSPDDEFICFLDPVAAQGFDLAGPNVRPVIVPMGVAPTAAAAADGYRAPLDMLRLTRAVWRERPDVFFSPSVYTYFPLPPGQRAVVTVHDAIAERFPELTLPSPRARLFWRLKVGLALRQARLVLTVSDFAAGRSRRCSASRRGGSGSPARRRRRRTRRARTRRRSRRWRRGWGCRPGRGGSRTWAASTRTSTWMPSCGRTRPWPRR